MALEGSQGGKKLLVVEDDPLVLELLCTILQAEGFEIRGAPDGETALILATSESFDGMLLDLCLPRMDGFGVLKALRAAGVYLPSIVISARNSELDVRQGFELGILDYLVKPFEEQDLLERIACITR